jgi:flavin reductase (DIM6/NTAB) family NADH-FMN oxidoreductase RutF
MTYSPGQPGERRNRSTARNFGQHATGVGVITAISPDGSPAGMTINSLTSVSPGPPLVPWCLQRSPARFSVFAGAGYFGVRQADGGDHLIIIGAPVDSKVTGHRPPLVFFGARCHARAQDAARLNREPLIAD